MNPPSIPDVERPQQSPVEKSSLSMLRHVEVPDPLRAAKRRVPRPVKRVIRRAVRRYGEHTADQRTLPDFLIIGTKRGGTTSVWNWLVRHPNVAPMFPALQQIKSPHYFDIHYHRGERWYRSHFPSRAALDRAAQRSGIRPLTGEASPYYLFHPLAPERVQHTVPKARLVALLRNPVDRAYSNYWERRGSNAECLPTFEAAIDAEEERLRGQTERILADPDYYSYHHDWHSYLARGRYVEQVARWLERFGRAQLLVMPFEDLRKDPIEAYRTVQEFLSLPVVEPPRLPHHNKLPAPPMAAATRERLVEYYRPFNARLTELLGTPFDWDR
ncbi:sulfotransferase domain-containing protein [Cryptosporangium aurantiacum]|uniref:Sulfotransferase domain-containing protein n=1 Tax=Cryptosporangium aurantiacum TaxID=134849 RepID=A0A1M7RJX0_9ACTN|nr:sulfotransferase domain-containing protein [Cryptosporangium aurantiacum]SHN46368.1 Sulfotransferase domain-containing protein [Cryptosporangium aurantiacum]